MPVDSSQPYLSIVVTSRNDNHGGDLNRRTQTFIASVAEQCRRHKLRTELIFVEWNPPPDRGPLADELHWPDADGWCSYRMITVPRETHLQLACGDSLPLYQMYAKNIGIRRARGEHVLATNVDLIFSDELTSWLAKQKLKPGHYYRTDRHDVPMDVMALTDPDEQLAFCRNNLLRVHTKHGTIDGTTWSQTSFPRLARWRQQAGRLVSYLLGRSPDGAAIKGKRRPLPARVLSALVDLSPRKVVTIFGRLLKLGVRAGRKLTRVGRKLWWHYFKLTLGAIVGVFRLLLQPHRWARVARQGMLGLKRQTRGWTNPLNRMHTNGCGDFTLMSRADWDRLGGYAELEIFSWHLDSLLIYTAYHSGMLEVVVPHHLYHIEHRGGWTPESAEVLWARLRQKGIPFLTNEDLDLLHERILATDGVYEFNDASWGMARHDLADVQLTPGRQASPIAARAA